MRTQKRPSSAPEVEKYPYYATAKKLYRQFRRLERILVQTHKTVIRMSDLLRDMNSESYAFWNQFNKDFPEMKLDISNLKIYSGKDLKPQSQHFKP